MQMATEMQSPLPAGAGGRGRKASGERDTRRERAWAGQGRGEVGAGGGGKAWRPGWGKPPPERQARPQTPRVTIGFSVTPAALPASAGRAAGPRGLCPAPKGSIHPTKGLRGDLDPTPQPAGTRAQVPVHGASVPTPQLLLPLHVGTQGSHISWPPLPVQEGGLGAPLISRRAPRKRHLLKAHILRAPVPQTGRDGPL